MYSKVPSKILYAFLVSPKRATWPVSATTNDLITLIFYVQKYKNWISFQPPF
jgi:hypothetical protein